ncbi:M48 family metallopeptidase [Desulfovibrio litoralis]|uniref:Zn-dependent protease with chaperone function n=1 Tax=Desulfovibrio litoralis DSM 11393 TaxID=1121455 RepID=A0A1M7S0X3_9BACT|nr:M48 family metallopeptidase [Desulfovibrio litoralis]SHN52090.1 Zn-dependent protease with chaperone function [Desulfovibrio litoralis DSM 11393]
MTSVKIKDLHSSEYEHPLDRIGLEALRKIPLFPKVLELCTVPQNSITRLELFGSNLKVSERQMPSLYKLMKEACETLEVEEPLFYLSSAPQLNAYTACPDKPIVCIYSYLLDILTDDEIRFVIGHELSHIKSQHIVYQALGTILGENLLSAVLSTVPGLSTFSQPAIYALNYAYFEWYRAAEYSCDRGGYLACQNFTASCTALMKLAGSSQRYVNELNLEEFIEQSRNFESVSSQGLGLVQKIILSNGRSHPWSVSRVHELVKFNDSGEYTNILERKAPRKELPSASDETANTTSTADKAKDAAKGLVSGFSKGFGKLSGKSEKE